MPLANSGAYVNLEAFGFTANAAITGNSVAFQDAGYGGGPFQFYGNPQTNVVYFTDDGFASLDIPSVLGTPYVNAPIPSAGLPDALMAMVWNDMEIVYEAGAGEQNRGATTGIQLTSGGIPSGKLQEFDDIQLVGDPSSQIDYEMFITEFIDDAPGEYEVTFGYDNLTGAFATGLTIGSIGVENYDGSMGTQYAYNDANLALQDGMAVCFDYAVPVKPVEITFQAILTGGLDVGDVFTNTVCHNTDNPGSEEACVDLVVTVEGPTATWDKTVVVYDGTAAIPLTLDDFPYEGVEPGYKVMVEDTVTVDYCENITFTLMEEWNDSLGLLDYGTVILPGGSATFPGMEVTMPMTDTLLWSVTDLPNDWTYIITKTFEVTGTLSLGDSAYLTETLEVEDADPEQVVLEFMPSEWDIYLPLVMRAF
jgi:hypothetical protein